METNYQQCLHYIFEKLPMFTRIGSAAYKPNLDNIIALCEHLGNPHLQFKSIHIAGTNGKGSCSHLLAAILQQNGYKTGLYTSPHVIDFRERIKINGQEISQQNVVDFIEKLKPFIEKYQPSFFEITVGMAFDFFAKQHIDIAIIEVGLGGLLDSTNIIHPLVSVITNISKDHTNLLGNTIEEIATQKAGIIKQNTPVVIGETQPETEKIFFAKSIQLQSQILFADKIYSVVNSEYKKGKQFIKIVNRSLQTIDMYELDLIGNYQQKNIKTVLATIDVLKMMDFHLVDEKIKYAIAHAKTITGFMGRFDIVKQNPTLVFDVSHNEAGINELLQQIQSIPHQNIHFILAFVADKDVDKVLSYFPKNANYYFTQAQIPRALAYTSLYEKAQQHHLQGTALETITQSLQTVLSKAQHDDLIVLTGSFFNLQEAYTVLQKMSE